MLTAAAIKTTAIAVTGLAGLAIAALLHGDGASGPEPPMRKVAMPGSRSLLAAVHEVTRSEWQACVADGACAALAGEATHGTAAMPMTGVNHFDAEDYVRWINRSGNRRYRLPTADEWHVLGAELPKPAYRKLFTDPRMDWAADYASMARVSAVLRPGGSFGVSRDGIADLAGNVWEWTSTCTLKDAGADRCPAYLVEGLHETAMPVFVRDPASGGCAVGAPPANIGLRLVSDP